MTNHDLLRPRDVAILLLADSRRPPRQRARDQQADHVGLQIRREMLERLVALDPDIAQLELVLSQLVELHIPSSGPARAVAIHVRDEILSAINEPGLVEHLLDGAIADAANVDLRNGGGERP